MSTPSSLLYCLVVLLLRVRDIGLLRGEGDVARPIPESGLATCSGDNCRANDTVAIGVGGDGLEVAL